MMLVVTSHDACLCKARWSARVVLIIFRKMTCSRTIVYTEFWLSSDSREGKRLRI